MDNLKSTIRMIQSAVEETTPFSMQYCSLLGSLAIAQAVDKLATLVVESSRFDESLVEKYSEDYEGDLRGPKESAIDPVTIEDRYYPGLADTFQSKPPAEGPVVPPPEPFVAPSPRPRGPHSDVASALNEALGAKLEKVE